MSKLMTVVSYIVEAILLMIFGLPMLPVHVLLRIGRNLFAAIGVFKVAALLNKIDSLMVEGLWTIIYGIFKAMGLTDDEDDVTDAAIHERVDHILGKD